MRSRVRGGPPGVLCSSLGFGFQEQCALVDEASEVAPEEEAFRGTAEQTERRGELDPVNHACAVAVRHEDVFVAHRGEGAADLFVYEPVERLVDGDAAGHAPADSPVAR